MQFHRFSSVAEILKAALCTGLTDSRECASCPLEHVVTTVYYLHVPSPHIFDAHEVQKPSRLSQQQDVQPFLE